MEELSEGRIRITGNQAMFSLAMSTIALFPEIEGERRLAFERTAWLVTPEAASLSAH
jgi:hypothetical protein